MNMYHCFVNPALRYGSSPSVTISVDKYSLPPNPRYTNTQACYWYQDGESGLTDFLFHTPFSQCTNIQDNFYETPQSEGFGGKTFTLTLVDGSIVNLRGPWSGGSGGLYGANQYLPEPSIEVTFKQSRHSFIAGNITWRVLKKLLPKGWDIVDSADPYRNLDKTIIDPLLASGALGPLKDYLEEQGVEYQKTTGKYWPELVYKGELKKEWSKETLEALHEEYIRMNILTDEKSND